MLKELKKLTQLRKLGVTGINKNNCKELCSAIADHSHLQSLSMRAEGEPGLEGCLDDLSPPPNNLQSLKLYGYLVKLPEWIRQLPNIVKLKLQSTQLEQNAIQVLGALQNLAILCLESDSFNVVEIHFRCEAFASLTVLELSSLNNLRLVEFEEESLPKLQLVQIDVQWSVGSNGFSGLNFLSSLKEVSVKGLLPLRLLEHLCDLVEKGDKVTDSENEKLKQILKDRLDSYHKFNEDLQGELCQEPKQASSEDYGLKIFFYPS